MSIDGLMQSLRVLAQADARIADMTFRSRLSQIALHSAAFIIAVFGLIMLGVAAYIWLSSLWGPAWAALATALGSFVVAILIALIASARKPGKEMEMAREMHVVALDALIAEMKRSGSEFIPFGTLLRGHGDSALLSLIGPLAALLLRFLRRQGGHEAEK